MYYADIKKADIANGVGVRVSVFVSGCTHHCKNCFNEEAWDFHYGNEFTQNEIDKGYSIKSFKLNEAISKIEENIPNHEKNKLISLDMIEAIKEYLKQCE